MLKKILLISVILSLFVTLQTTNASHYDNWHNNYNNNWDYNRSCNGGIYNGYPHWFLRDGQYTQSTKRISNWQSYVSIVCNNWNLSRKILELRCNSWYSRQWNYCRENRNTNSHHNNNPRNNNSNYNYNRNSCNAGTYHWYSHPFLRNSQSVSSSKNITNWRAYVTVQCRNGNLSRRINSIKCNNWYSRQWNYCKENRNTNSYHNNNYNRDSCNAGTYNWYSHIFLRNWQSTSSSKNITNWRAYVLVQCRNGNLSRKILWLRCNSWYSRQWNYCRENRNYSYNR